MRVSNSPQPQLAGSTARAQLLRFVTILIALSCIAASHLSQATESTFRVLSYHDVVLTRDQLNEDAVTLDHLINHFEWLLANGYHPVSVEHILEARKGARALPDNAVLLTFDDAYVSFYDYVLPLLKAYDYPAVLALVGSWMETPPKQTVAYGDKGMNRDDLLTWQQVAEIESSGLVEIASHSFNLHREVIANPQGNGLASAVTLEYLPKNKTYESLISYRQRIDLDLKKAQRNIKQRLGHKSRVLVWPYGRYTDIAIDAAKNAGFEMTLTLNREPARLHDLMHTGRYYVWRNPTPLDFREMLENPLEKIIGRFPLLEANALSEGNAEHEKKLALWLDRCSKLRPDGVCIRPYSFSNGEVIGFAPSDHLPTKQNLLLRLTWQTLTRGRSNPILWLVNDRKKWAWADQQMIQTWPELGSQSPVFAVVIGGSQISPAIATLPWNLYCAEEDQLTLQSPSLRRNRRQAFIRHTRDKPSFAREVLQQIDKFQIWQPYARVYLQLSWSQARSMPEHQLKSLLLAFDRLVLDARDLSLRDLKKDLKQMQLQPSLITHGQLLINFDKKRLGSTMLASRNLTRKLENIEKLGILSWIYDHDHPIAQQPDLEQIRPMMSAESYPWNYPEFRLWSENEDKQKRKQETP